MEKSKSKIIEIFKTLGVPKEYFPEEIFLDVILIAKRKIFLVGLSSRHAIGSAAEFGAFPLERAAWEYLERLSIVLSQESDERGNESWVMSKSNGVAIHTDSHIAQKSALLELTERDRILRAWYGDQENRVQINRLEVSKWSGLDRVWIRKLLEESHEMIFCEFVDSLNPNIFVYGLFSFGPSTLPLVYGLGAGFTHSAAVSKCLGEFVQRLAFLWGEENPMSPPHIEPSPHSQQEFYLYPPHAERILNWLKSGGRSKAYLRPEGRRFLENAVQFENKTPTFLKGKAFVIKAVSESHVPLTFGAWHPSILDQTPPDVAIHPIA